MEVKNDAHGQRDEIRVMDKGMSQGQMGMMKYWEVEGNCECRGDLSLVGGHMAPSTSTKREKRVKGNQKDLGGEDNRIKMS